MSENLLKELIFEFLLLERKKSKQKRRKTTKRRAAKKGRKKASSAKKGKSSSSLSNKTRETLKNKAEKANMPLGALTAVYRKGLAAWLSGHRPGIPQHQWAMARVNSFIRGGKTRSVDKSEWEKVKKFRERKKKKKKWTSYY